MVLFRKRINAQMIAEANESMLSNLNKKNDEDDDPKPPTEGGTSNDDPVTAIADKKLEYQDNTDRIEVERELSVDKRCYGMGKIVTKLEETQLTSIALSVFVANLFKIR